MWLWLYKNLMRGATPLLAPYLQRRITRGKEDPARINERRGIASLTRPQGRLVWLHGASVGEAQSLLALINRLLVENPDLHIMVTTGTVTSAKLMADRLPPHAFHQYIPLDQPAWVARFLDHWRPDLVIWSESELWPNLLTGIKTRNIPAVLVNARLSERSFQRWKKLGSMAKTLLTTFDLCLAQNNTESERLTALGAPRVTVSGNLKYASTPLPVDANHLTALQQATATRPVILWASTHPDEESVAARAHIALKTINPHLLTIIAPRHPMRGNDIADLVRGYGLKVVQRSQSTLPADNDDIYIADTMGEMGLFYRLAPSCIIGGSFVPHGGHNPIEPAQLGCLIFYGPYMFNFVSICNDFESRQAAIALKDEAGLIDALNTQLQAPDTFKPVSDAASAWVASQAHIVDDVCRAITVLLPAQGGDA